MGRAWFKFAVSSTDRTSQTFSAEVQPFENERSLLSDGAFKKTVTEKGRRIPLLDRDECQVGELYVMWRPAKMLAVQGKLWSSLDTKLIAELEAAARIALEIGVEKRNGDIVTEVRLVSAMFRGKG